MASSFKASTFNVQRSKFGTLIVRIAAWIFERSSIAIFVDMRWKRLLIASCRSWPILNSEKHFPTHYDGCEFETNHSFLRSLLSTVQVRPYILRSSSSKSLETSKSLINTKFRAWILWSRSSNLNRSLPRWTPTHCLSLSLSSTYHKHYLAKPHYPLSKRTVTFAGLALAKRELSKLWLGITKKEWRFLFTVFYLCSLCSLFFPSW